MENDKKPNKLIIVIIILVIILAISGIVGYFFSSSNKNENHESNNTVLEVDNNVNEKNYGITKYEGETFYFDRLSKNSYGFIVMRDYNDNTKRMISLNNGESNKDILVVPSNVEIHSTIYKNDKFYFALERKNDDKVISRIIEIDLNTNEVREVTNDYISEKIKVLELYDYNNEYIFYIEEELDKILINKINRITGDKETIYEIATTSMLSDFFYDSKSNSLYFSYESYTKNKSVIKYIKLSLNGEKTILKKEDYIKVTNRNIIIREGDNIDNQYMYFNGKKVTLKENKIYLEDKQVYNPKNNDAVSFLYVEDSDKAIFEIVCTAVQIGECSYESKYATLNVNTEKIKNYDESVFLIEYPNAE